MFTLKLLRESRKLYRLAAIKKSSSYKRSHMGVVHFGEHIQTIKSELFEHGTVPSISEWEELRTSLISKYRHLNNQNVDSLILGLCKGANEIALAKSYMHYMQTSGMEPNIATMGRLLRVYNSAYHTRGSSETALTEADQKDIVDMCSKLRRRHDFLDAITCENLICGLVCTEEWRMGLELLDMIRLTSTPSSTVYAELIVKSFSNGDEVCGWELLQQMVSERKEPKCEIYLAYLRNITKEPSTLRIKLEKLFSFLEQNDLIITAVVAQFILKLNDTLLLSAKTTQLKKEGKCNCCGLHMKRISISDAQYAKLSNSFLNKVLIRNDIFQKSTPEEIERFKCFVTKTAPYDCVIDGLNVAYSSGVKNPQKMVTLLASVVKHFKSQGKHVLVLGRMHMNSWPKDIMLYIRRNAKLFLTNNISQDDPFLLYATLKSGQSTDFMSRDLMRSHSFLLGDELKTIFRRWQQEHQYSLITQTNEGRVIVKEPIRHMVCAHQVQDTWHVPYKPTYSPNPPETFEIPESWLCIKFNKSYNKSV